MDRATQQNAAMVEETTAASHSLAQEAEGLTLLTGKFRVGTTDGVARRPSEIPTARPHLRAVPSRGGTARELQAALADEGWREF
jgi:methyl-accepting chemotaxis protein